MRRFLAPLILLSSVASADPDFDSIAKRLASDDPAERAAAAAEARGLEAKWVPELEKRAGEATDAEAAAALREAALWLEEGRHLRLAREFAAANGKARTSLLNSAGASALPALVTWMRHAGQEDFPGREADADAIPAQILAAETFADFGDDVAKWRVFARNFGSVWLDDVRLAGLSEAGFKVGSNDPAAAAEEWRLVWKASFPEGSGAKQWRGLSDGNRRRLRENIALFLKERFRPEVFGEGFMDDPELTSCVEWLAANRDGLVLRSGRVESEVPVESLVLRIEDGDATVRRGVLRSLCDNPADLPDSAWDHVEDADIFMAPLARAGRTVPEEKLGATLAALGSKAAQEPSRSALSRDAVGTWLASAPTGAAGIEPAVRFMLAGRGNDPFPPGAKPLDVREIRRKVVSSEDAQDAVVAAASDWVAAHHGFLEFREGSFHSRATAADQKKVVEAGGNRGAVRGALRSLLLTPTEIPDAAWKILPTDAEFLMQIMAACKKPPPTSRLGSVLAAVGAPLNRDPFRHYWDLYALADWLSTAGKDDPARAAVVALLIEEGEEAQLQTVIDVMGPPDRFEFKMESGRAGSLATRGEPASARFAVAWVRRADEKEKLPMAWNLTQGGQRIGLEMIAALIADRKFAEPDLARLRYSVSACPPDYDLDAWVKWAKSDLSRYSWDQPKGKWIPK